MFKSLKPHKQLQAVSLRVSTLSHFLRAMHRKKSTLWSSSRRYIFLQLQWPSRSIPLVEICRDCDPKVKHHFVHVLTSCNIPLWHPNSKSWLAGRFSASSTQGLCPLFCIAAYDNEIICPRLKDFTSPPRFPWFSMPRSQVQQVVTLKVLEISIASKAKSPGLRDTPGCELGKFQVAFPKFDTLCLRYMWHQLSICQILNCTSRVWRTPPFLIGQQVVGCPVGVLPQNKHAKARPCTCFTPSSCQLGSKYSSLFE